MALRLRYPTPEGEWGKEDAMKEVQVLQRFTLIGVAVLVLVSLSLFADDRHDWRTGGVTSEVRVQPGHGAIEGIVVGVSRNGHELVLRNGRQDIRIDTRGSVPVHYRGHRYRVHDLEQGDRVAVELRSTSSARPRARAVNVLWSVSHDGRYDRRVPGRHSSLQGQVVSIDHARHLMVLRVDSPRREIIVDTWQLDRGRNRMPFRKGDRVIVDGSFNGRFFVAQAIHQPRRW
jgi:hypothetical protein